MRKKLVLIFAVLIITAMVLGACAPKEPEVVPTEEVVAPTEEVVAPTEEVVAPTEEPVVDLYADVVPATEITFWHQHSGDREVSLLEIVDEFNATNGYGITLTAEYAGGYGDIFTKMLPILNTADVPDIVVGYQNQIATYQLADSIWNMSEVMDSPTWGMPQADQDDFFPGFFAQDIFPSFGNARLGLPPNRSMEVMYYNMDWLTELGYDAPPATPEEFKEMACAATANPYSGATAEGSLGYQLSVDASRFASWTFAFGGDMFDYENNLYDVNSDAAVAAFEYLQDLFDEGCATIVTERYGDQTDFGNGTLLFTVGSSSGLPYYGSAVEGGANFEWSVAALPNAGTPKQDVYGASVSIPKSTPERQLAAWLFVKYYTSPDVQAKWAKASNYFPVRASVAEGMLGYFAANPVYKKAFEMLEYSAFEPPVPGYDFVRDEIEMVMAALVDDPTLDVATELATLNVLANEILAEQMAQIQ